MCKVQVFTKWVLYYCPLRIFWIIHMLMNENSEHRFTSFSSFSKATTFEIEENFGNTTGCPTGCNCFTLDPTMFSFHFNMYFWSAEWCTYSAANVQGFVSLFTVGLSSAAHSDNLATADRDGQTHTAKTQQHSGVTKTEASPNGWQRGAICSRFKDFRLSEEFYSRSTLHIRRRCFNLIPAFRLESNLVLTDVQEEHSSPCVPSPPSLTRASTGSRWKLAFSWSLHPLGIHNHTPTCKWPARHEGAHGCMYSSLLAHRHACAETYTAWPMSSA